MRTAKLVLLAWLVALAGCGSGGGGNGSSATVTNSIVGLWQHVYPATQCIETNEFLSTGEYIGLALDEVYRGTYAFEETVPAGQRHELSVEVQEDNQQADCAGRNTDTTGTARTVYVAFTSPERMEFYTRKTGGELIIDFTHIENN